MVLVAKSKIAVHWLDHCTRTKIKSLQMKLHQHNPAVDMFVTSAMSNVACILAKAVVQCTGVESLHTCMKIKYENQVPTGDRSMLPCFHGNHRYDVFLCPTGLNAGVQLFFLFLGLSWFP